MREFRVRMIRIIKNAILNSLLSLVSIIRCLRRSSFFPSVNSIKINNNSSCYILGNGPSLREFLKHYLPKLLGCKLIVVNDFVKSEYFEKLKPEIYIIADPAYYDEYIHSELKYIRDQFTKLLLEKTKWPLILLVPYSAYKTELYKSYFKINQNISLYFYNPTEFKGFGSLENLFFSLNIGMPRAQNVLIPCLFLSLNLGFKEINLIGAEHSWTQNLVVNDFNQVCIIDNHFYDEEDAKIIPWRMLSGEIFKMHEILSYLSWMFEGYHRLNVYAKKLNAKIYNRTPNSFIDAFERKDIND